MTTTWFLCPYDVFKDPGLMRRCAMYRYIPFQNNKDGNAWDEIEVRGNHTVVKVSATDTILAAIRADTDFTEIMPTVTKEIRTAFEALGYAPVELTGTTAEELLRSVCATKSVVVPNASHDGVLLSSVIPNTTKTFDTTNAKVG